MSLLSLPPTLLPSLPTPTRLAASRSSLRSAVLVAMPLVAMASPAVVVLVAVVTALAARVAVVSSVKAVVALLPVVVVATWLPTRAAARPRPPKSLHPLDDFFQDLYYSDFDFLFDSWVSLFS